MNIVRGRELGLFVFRLLASSRLVLAAGVLGSNGVAFVILSLAKRPAWRQVGSSM